MVPVLLNVEHTAPYMHDGRFKTLEEVVEHYNSGIQSHPNLDPMLTDFSGVENMTEQQRRNEGVGTPEFYSGVIEGLQLLRKDLVGDTLGHHA